MYLVPTIKLQIHRFAYKLSFLLPLAYLWKRLHLNDYHPDVDGIKDRILRTREDSRFKLFERWSSQLEYKINLLDKSVLEIGHGGGWYLAEALDAGASSVTGYEIADEINLRANKAFTELGLTNFHFLKGDGRSLRAVSDKQYDFVFSITVLQHIPTRVTKRYLQEINHLLIPGGVCVLQVLQKHGASYKRLSKADLFSVAYSKKEFDEIVDGSGLKIKNYVIENYDSDETYWGVYLLGK
jgi:SAM-dependent methyltransferase